MDKYRFRVNGLCKLLAGEKIFAVEIKKIQHWILITYVVGKRLLKCELIKDVGRIRAQNTWWITVFEYFQGCIFLMYVNCLYFVLILKEDSHFPSFCFNIT